MDPKPTTDLRDLDLSVGVERIDAQHREVVKLLGELTAAGDSEDAEIERLREAVSFLVSHVTTHFDDEERLMEEVGYPDLAHHRHQHSAMLRDLFVVVASTEGAPSLSPLTARRVQRFLTGWLVEHVGEFDLDFARFLRSREAGGDQRAG